MTMCVIERFTVNGQQVAYDKANTVVASLNPDRIAGYSLTDCALAMELLKPNELTFSIRRNTITKSDDFKHYTIVKHLIGQKVVCQVSTYLDQQKTSTIKFEGTIAKVSMKGLNIECVANSAEADLQGPSKCRCFTDMKIEEIVNSVVPASMTKKVDLQDYVKNLVFPYIVQYNESDYDFLCRLAKRFGAFFYFDQTQHLVFGKLPDNQPKDIQAPNVASVSYELQTIDPNFCYATHYDQKNVDMKSDGADPRMFNAAKLMQMAVKASGKLERGDLLPIDEPNSLPKDPTPSWIDDYNLVMLSGQSGEMGVCKFISYLFDIEVGSVIKINDNGLMVVTAANLTWDCNGSPQNEVTAMLLPNDTVDTDIILAPYMDCNAYPKSSAQRAVVVNNVDPQKMGRVQVQFVWQEDPANAQERAKLPWLRIAQPYGGNKKGFFVLPEIGEEVMVGFEHENMEKPFVIGTLFHNSDKDEEKQLPENTWCEVNDPNAPNNKVNVGNEVKAFRTKKGHTIEFHDIDGDSKYGYIRIYGNEKKDGPNYDIILSTDPIQVPKADNSGKEDYQTTGPKTEGIEAGKDIAEQNDYKASKLRLMVRSNGGDIVLDAGTGDIIMNAKNIRVHATGDATTLIEKKNIMKVKDGQFVDVKSNSLVVQGNQTVMVKGEDTEEYQNNVTVTSNETFTLKPQKVLDIGPDQKADVKLKANSLKMETSGNSTIKGSDIDITATSGAANITATSGAANITGKTGLTLDGTAQADLKAKAVIVDGEVSETLKGGKLDIQGTESISATSGKVSLTSASGSLAGAWKLP